MGRYDKLRGMIKDTHKERKKKVQKVFPLMFSKPKASSKAKAEFNKSYAQSKARQTKYKSPPRKKYSDVEKKGYTLPKKWRGEGKNEMRISEMSKSKVGRGVLGATTGAAKSLLINPQEQRIPKKTKDSMSYKVGDFVGSNLAYLLPSGALSGTASKVGAKAVASKTGQKAVKKLATKNAFKKTGEKGAKEFLERVTTEAVRDIPSGAILANNRLLTEGEKFGSKEYNKEMALNTALDVGIGGAIDWLPVATKGLKNAKARNKANSDAVKEAYKIAYENPKKNRQYVTKKRSNLTKAQIKDKSDNLVKKFADDENKPRIESLINGYDDYVKAKTVNKELPKKNVVSDVADETLNVKPTSNSIENDGIEKVLPKKATKVKANEKTVPKVVSEPIEEVTETIKPKATEEPKADFKISSKDFETEKPLPPKRNKKMPPKLKDKSNTFSVADDVIEDTQIMADGRVRAFNKDGSKVHTAIDENGDIYQMTFNKDGTTTATRIRDGKVRNLPSGTVKEGHVDKSMGKNERLVSENLKEYGHMDKSTAIPKATEFGETSEAFETMLTGGRLDDHAEKLLNELHSYEGIGSKAKRIELDKKLEAQRSEISKLNGDIDRAIDRYNVMTETETLSNSADVTAYEVALTEEIIKQGRYDLLEDVVSSSVMRRSLQGQALSASKLFNTQSPVGRTMTMQKVAKKMSKEYGVEVKISDEQLKRLAEATDEFELNQIKNEIHVEMWNQVPPTMYDKLTAWRYTCMLANPRTHIRNIMGNAIMMPLRATRNVIAEGLEAMLVKDGGLKSKAMLTVDDEPLLELAKENFKKNHHALTDSQKFNEFRRPQEADVFKFKILEKLRKGNSALLEMEDEWTFKPLYEKSYAQFLKANGFDINNPSKELLEMAGKYATNEALEGTYRNRNALAEFISKAKADANKPLSMIRGDSTAEKVLRKSWAMLVDTMIPFSKTPTNVLARSLDYSPVGLGKGLYKMVNAEGDQMMFLKGISDFSAGLTGTGVLGVGLYLGHMGIANGSLDINDPKSRFMKENGAQDYAINITIGDNTYTYSLDWATPSSIPLFIGVELSKGFEGFSFSKVLDALGQMTDPVFSLSMLSGLQQSLDTSFGSENPVVDITNNVVQGRLSQYIPTLAGQFARVMTADRKIGTSTSEGKLARSYESWFRQMLNKVPGLSATTEPYVDTLGQRDTKKSGKDYGLAFFNNFLNPGVLKKVQYDDVDKELLSLGEDLGSEGAKAILPKRTSTYEIKNGEDKVRMNEKELTLYKETRGQYSKEKLEELFNSSEYDSMSNEDKQKAISNIYTEARKKADKEVLLARGVPEEDIDFNMLSKSIRDKYTGGDKKAFVDTYNGMHGYRTHVAKHLGAIKNGASFNDVQMLDTKAKRDTYGKAVVLYRLGISPETVDTYAKSADYNGNGRRSVDEVISFLNGQDLSREQKRVLFDVLVRSRRNPY